MVIRFYAALDRRSLMRKELVIECINKERPLPVLSVTLEYRHAGYSDFNRLGCVPLALNFVGECYMFFSCVLVGISPCFGVDTGLLAAFVC